MGSSSGSERISDEVVVAEDPDVIIAVPHAEEDDIPNLSEYLRTNPAWTTTSAVGNGRICISVDNSLLQAGTDAARTIRKVRRLYLHPARDTVALAGLRLKLTAAAARAIFALLPGSRPADRDAIARFSTRPVGTLSGGHWG